jgi:hypothetical protein
MNAYGFYFVKPGQHYSGPRRNTSRRVVAKWRRSAAEAAQELKDAAKEQRARKDLRIQSSETIARANGRFEARRPTRRSSNG